MESPSRFKGKVVLVTGASQGIGEAISLRFANEGQTWCFAPTRNKSSMWQTEPGNWVPVLALLVDVSDKAQVASLFKQIQDEFSVLDVSVHNADDH